jgi:hypothetical protein
VHLFLRLPIRQFEYLRQDTETPLANGYNGYLPTPEHHALGGYETWRARSSYLGVKSSEVIEKALGEMLSELAGK